MIKTRWISIGEGFQAYLAIPEAGHGPGLLLLSEIFGVNASVRATAGLFAEEGYVVLAPDLFWRSSPGLDLGYSEPEVERALGLFRAFDFEAALQDVALAADVLATCPEVTGDLAVLGHCLGGALALGAASSGRFKAAAAYYPVLSETTTVLVERAACPTVIHIGDDDPLLSPRIKQDIHARAAANPRVRIYAYPGAGHAFANPDRKEFVRLAADIAHTRTLETIRPAIGPHYDLAALWEAHLAHEFVDLDAAATIATMTSDAYVNHIANLTGGYGRKELHHFYANHFVTKHAGDTQVTAISRTVGVNRVVDEAVASFVHDREIDYLLPGVGATGKRVEMPYTVIVTFRGPKLHHEHIYWDAAGVLKQLGLVDFGSLPVAGAEQAAKVRDNSVPSNQLMPAWSPPR